MSQKTNLKNVSETTKKRGESTLCIGGSEGNSNIQVNQWSRIVLLNTSI